jgi:hypothetical protein
VGRKKNAEPWARVRWFGKYDHGYFGDDDGTYTGNDDADLRVGEIGNKFDYHMTLNKFKKGGNNRYSLRIWFAFDSNKYSQEVFSSTFRTKREAKQVAVKEIMQFEHNKDRVMKIWNRITSPEYRTAMFRSCDSSKKNYDWVASGFACASACDVISQRWFSYGGPSYSSINDHKQSRFLTLNVTNRCWQDREAGIMHSWDMCELLGSGLSGSGGRRYVTDSLSDIESLVVKCLITSEFDIEMYNWIVFRRNRYVRMPT